MTKRYSDSFLITVDDNEDYHLVDSLELSKYALKANVDPQSGSKYTPSDEMLKGNNILDPKYNPYYLVQLLDLYTYHASCVEAVSVDATGIDYSLKPVEGVEPVDAEKERLEEVLQNSTPSINSQLQRMVYDRRSIGYGAIEIIRDTTSKSDIKRLKHIPAHTLRRHTDQKRVVHINSMGKKVWFVIYGKNYNADGELCDIDADTGEFKPYNSLPPHKEPTNYYGVWSMLQELIIMAEHLL